MGTILIRPADPLEPGAAALLKASHDLMLTLFPSEANHLLSLDALRASHIEFFVAELNDTTVGCAALAKYPEYCEVKSMFVATAARGTGVAAALLTNLIERARSEELPVLRLETGTGLDAAHRLYARFGFEDCAAFGSYLPDAPFSRYMELAL